MDRSGFSLPGASAIFKKMIITIAIVLVGLVVLIWQGSLLISAFSGAPTVYAKTKIIKQAFELAELKTNQTVVDLGCGNARSLIIAAKEFGAKGIGIEISPFYFMLARLNVFLAGQSKNIKIYYGNLTNHLEIVKRADLIFIYLLESLMAKIEENVFSMINQKTHVVTLSFPFHKHDAIKTNKSPRIYLYKKFD